MGSFCSERYTGDTRTEDMLDEQKGQRKGTNSEIIHAQRTELGKLRFNVKVKLVK